MALLSGEYPVTLDEKGRLSIPAKFREGIPGNILILTKGFFTNSIWAFAPSSWDEFHEKISGEIEMAIINNSLDALEADMLRHRTSFPPNDVEIDKSGRIAIPQKLRQWAGLINKDCVVASDGKRLELWDKEQYEAYQKMIDDQLQGIFKKMRSTSGRT